MPQHAILRFEKHKGNPARPLEAPHKRQKKKYAINPDIDTSRSRKRQNAGNWNSSFMRFSVNTPTIGRRRKPGSKV